MIRRARLLFVPLRQASRLLAPLLLVGCVVGVRPGSTALGPESCAWRVCIETDDGPAGRTYEVTNDEPVPVTVVLTFRRLENLVRPAGGRVERIIPAGSTDRIRLQRIRSGPLGADLAISVDLGASTTRPDDYVYAVPFGGSEPRPIIQAFDSGGTHAGSMRYSLDVAMPADTTVLAARAGVVLYLQDGFSEGRADPELLERANMVVVAHRDGSVASYGHLARGLEVEVGDTVAVGELLGWSGRSGFAARSHLHFHVGLRMLGEPGRTIPIRMADRDGVAVDLREGALIHPARVGPTR